MGAALHAAIMCTVCLLYASACCGGGSMGRMGGGCKACGGGGCRAAWAGPGDPGSTYERGVPRAHLRMQLRGGEGEDESEEMELQRLGSTSSDDDGAGGAGAKSSVVPDEEIANTVLDDTDVEDDSAVGDGEEISEEDEGEKDVFVADPFEQPGPKTESKQKPKSAALQDRDEREREREREREKAAAAAILDASAEEDDRSEADEPFYNGVRVRNLFVDADTGTEAWCIGTVQYVRRSTGEYRIHFDEVPSWEPSKQVYWPAGDSDMKLAPSEDQGRTEEELAELTFKMLQHCQEGQWFNVRKMIFLGADVNARVDNIIGVTPLHMACISGECDMVEYLLEHGANVHEPATDGHTAMHWAASSGSEDVVRALVRKGANVHSRSKEDIKPIEYARMMEHWGVEKLLRRLMEKYKEKDERMYVSNDLALKMMSEGIDGGGAGEPGEGEGGEGGAATDATSQDADGRTISKDGVLKEGGEGGPKQIDGAKRSEPEGGRLDGDVRMEQ